MNDAKLSPRDFMLAVASLDESACERAGISSDERETLLRFGRFSRVEALRAVLPYITLPPPLGHLRSLTPAGLRELTASEFDGIARLVLRIVREPEEYVSLPDQKAVLAEITRRKAA